jgi:5-methylcytosine-specific restriction protein A
MNIELLRQRLERRFGLSLMAGTCAFDGEVFPILRPTDLEPGRGFCIAVSRTHRLVEASFRLDNFSGSLLRRMGDADEYERKTFLALLDQARADGTSVYFSVNGRAEGAMPDAAERWQRLELDVTRRLPNGRTDDAIVLNQALVVATVCLSLALALLPYEEGEDGTNAELKSRPEGALMRVEVNRYERSPANRAACIAHYGTTCQVCGFSFSAVYGDLGDGFVEVHHRVMVSEMGEGYFVNPVRDLVPVCGNCHAMLHRRSPPITIEELRALVGNCRTSPSN